MKEGGREREKGRIHGEVKVQFKALISFTCTCEQVPLCAIHLFHGTVLPFLSATEEVRFNNSVMETVDCREMLGWILIEQELMRPGTLLQLLGVSGVPPSIQDDTCPGDLDSSLSPVRSLV